MFQFRIDVFDVDLTKQRVIHDPEGDYVEMSYTRLINNRSTRIWLDRVIKAHASGEITSITLYPTRLFVQLAPSTNPDTVDQLLTGFFMSANESAARLPAWAQLSILNEDGFNPMAVSSVNPWDANNK